MCAAAAAGEAVPGSVRAVLPGEGTAQPRQAVRVQVPATSANLGPGFDALGLALDLYEEVALERLPPGAASRITVRGVQAGRLREDTNLLAYRAAAAVYQRLGRPTPPLRLELVTRIPRCGGLGGSAAAIVGGAVAANLLEGAPLSEHDLLELATDLEGHPDNVAPALVGGLVISVQGATGIIAKRLAPPPALSAVLFVPEHAISTKRARAILPRRLAREEAVFNLGRAALLVAAFATQDWPLLREAMDDRLHQPARARIYPALPAAIEAALAAGAHGAALSGAGAAIIALATARHEEIGQAMCRAAAAQGFAGRAITLALAERGAAAIPLE